MLVLSPDLPADLFPCPDVTAEVTGKLWAAEFADSTAGDALLAAQKFSTSSRRALESALSLAGVERRLAQLERMRRRVEVVIAGDLNGLAGESARQAGEALDLARRLLAPAWLAWVEQQLKPASADAKTSATRSDTYVVEVAKAAKAVRRLRKFRDLRAEATHAQTLALLRNTLEVLACLILLGNEMHLRAQEVHGQNVRASSEDLAALTALVASAARHLRKTEQPTQAGSRVQSGNAPGGQDPSSSGQ